MGDDRCCQINTSLASDNNFSVMMACAEDRCVRIDDIVGFHEVGPCKLALN